MSSIFRIILTTWVASKICCFLPIRVSTTCCCFMSAWGKRQLLLIPGGLPFTLICGVDLTYRLCSCEGSRCPGKSWTPSPAWLWPPSWFELDSDRCSQPAPLGSPPEHQQRTSWHTVPMLDTENKQTKKTPTNNQEIPRKITRRWFTACRIQCLTLSAASLTARAQAISEAPPP